MSASSSLPACWRRVISLCLIAAYLPACTSWHVQGPTPEVVVRDRAPPAIRITQLDGSTVVVHQPMIVADSIVGQPMAAKAGQAVVAPVAVALSTVKVLEVRRVDALRTVGATVGGLLLISVVGCAVTKCLEGLDDPPF
jgi:hypothetical protein